MEHRLIVVRHAKTERDASSDAARELTDRGRRQSAALGDALTSDVREPASALVSSAVRAVQTWRIAAERVGADVGEQVLDSLYSAGADDVLSAVHTVGDDVATAIVVGHNPTIAEVVSSLVGNRTGGAYDELRARGYSPATTTVFDLDGPWSDVDSTTTTLIRYVPPLS